VPKQSTKRLQRSYAIWTRRPRESLQARSGLKERTSDHSTTLKRVPDSLSVTLIGKPVAPTRPSALLRLGQVLDQQWELATACFDLGAVMIVFAYWYSIKISGASRRRELDEKGAVIDRGLICSGAMRQRRAAVVSESGRMTIQCTTVNSKA
jgi:hypothetical protein